MTKILLKETITKEREVEISLQSLIVLIEGLPAKEKNVLLRKLSASKKTGAAIKLVPFKKDAIKSILKDVVDADIYEDEFIRDLKEGLEKSSFYK